jgi:FtsZ-interacting cell division protein ZipA
MAKVSLEDTKSKLFDESLNENSDEDENKGESRDHKKNNAFFFTKEDADHILEEDSETEEPSRSRNLKKDYNTLPELKDTFARIMSFDSKPQKLAVKYSPRLIEFNRRRQQELFERKAKLYE